MFFQSKKKKIEKYLQTKNENCSAFDELLKDYISGQLKEDLISLNINGVEIHIDWLDDYKCIGVQGGHGRFFVDIQIYEKDFSIAYAEDEPDECVEYRLESKSQMYSILKETLAKS